MANETKVQAFIHALEESGWVSRIRLILLLAAIASVYCIVIFNFKGLNQAKGMDQAQIGRALASGHGFRTRYIRPLAYSQLLARIQRVTGNPTAPFPTEEVPDTYNAPLNPFVDSLILRGHTATARISKGMTGLPFVGYIFRAISVSDAPLGLTDIVYTNDRLIAGVSLLFFLASVALNFTIAKRLFDRRLALLGMGLVLISDVFWNFSLTGLPQMLMLLIFSGVCYCLVRTIENRLATKNPLLWLALSGVGFGLLILAHGLAVWLLLGAMLYLGIAFWPAAGPVWRRVLLHPVWIPAIVAMALEVPWLLRTYGLTGNPFGVALYSGYVGLIGTESQMMRSMSVDGSGIGLLLIISKVAQNIIGQLSAIYTYLGHSVVTPVFFLSMLHVFKRREAASFRWCVLSMWMFAVLGMACFGLEEEGAIHANDLHVLFIPTMSFYGLAFVLVLWSRLISERQEINIRLLRWSFFVLIYLVSAFPMAHLVYRCFTDHMPIQWPPYYPAYISVLNQWTNDDEIIASDMPWAVAWYADRKSLLLPDTIANFMDLHDYNRLGGPIVGLYLTPVSGDSKLLSDIMNGEYKEWSPFILRNVNTRSFPLDAVTALPIRNECIFYADRNRWSFKTD